MTQLVPCEACSRHVRSDAGVCPFCGAAVSARAPRARTTVRAATRAAIFYLGATIAGCDDDSQVTIYGGPPEPETIMQPYGAPPQPLPETPDTPETAETPEPEGPTLPREDPPTTLQHRGENPSGEPGGLSPDPSVIAPPYGAPPNDPVL